MEDTLSEKTQKGWVLGNNESKREQMVLDKLVYTLRELELGLNELSKMLNSVVDKRDTKENNED